MKKKLLLVLMTELLFSTFSHGSGSELTPQLDGYAQDQHQHQLAPAGYPCQQLDPAVYPYQQLAPVGYPYPSYPYPYPYPPVVFGSPFLPPFPLQQVNTTYQQGNSQRAGVNRSALRRSSNKRRVGEVQTTQGRSSSDSSGQLKRQRRTFKRNKRRCKDCGCAKCPGAQNGQRCTTTSEGINAWIAENGYKKPSRPSRSKLEECVQCLEKCWVEKNEEEISDDLPPVRVNRAF